MLAEASIVGFVPVSDMKAAEHFYAGKLGLSVVERGQFALVVASASGQQIRCVLTPDAKPQPFTVLGWEVADIHAAAKDLKAKKIMPIVYPHFDQDADGVWAAPGGKDFVVWFNDPDGNVLSLSQHGGVAAK